MTITATDPNGPQWVRVRVNGYGLGLGLGLRLCSVAVNSHTPSEVAVRAGLLLVC